MRIAYFVKNFPELSQTFIIQQIQGVLGLGHDVTIFAGKLVLKNPIVNSPSMQVLMEKTHFESYASQYMPANRIVRVAKAALLVIR